MRRVEDLGFSTFLVRDHLVPDFFGDQPAPLVALARAAALTTRLRVGTMVLAVDYRQPVVLVKEAATLDLLSGGRLELGLGAGWLRHLGSATRPGGIARGATGRAMSLPGRIVLSRDAGRRLPAA